MHQKDVTLGKCLETPPPPSRPTDVHGLSLFESAVSEFLNWSKNPAFQTANLGVLHATTPTWRLTSANLGRKVLP